MKVIKSGRGPREDATNAPLFVGGKVTRQPLVGTGVTAAAIFHLRDTLDAAGFGAVKIVASSGFTPAKCKVMASVEAPVDVIGTGSFLPERWDETYATADVIEYDGKPSVKAGREFLRRS